MHGGEVFLLPCGVSLIPNFPNFQCGVSIPFWAPAEGFRGRVGSPSRAGGSAGADPAGAFLKLHEALEYAAFQMCTSSGMQPAADELSCSSTQRASPRQVFTCQLLPSKPTQGPGIQGLTRPLVCTCIFLIRVCGVLSRLLFQNR